jgi:hypothetical protein
MPRILITTESAEESGVLVMMNERIAVGDLASDHFASQLVERIGWALADAEAVRQPDLGRLRAIC